MFTLLFYCIMYLCVTHNTSLFFNISPYINTVMILITSNIIMADPRNNLSFDVKPCGGPYYPQSVANINASTSARSSFFSNLGKIGNLEILNDIGGGAIGNALRTLTTVSNLVRTGCGQPPNILTESTENGANWVLSHLGISDQSLQLAGTFHPEAANIAYGHAKTIFSDISQGIYKIEHIPQYLASFQNIDRIARGIFTPGHGDRLNGVSHVCAAQPYAMDLFVRAPKYKFLFLVGFTMHPAFAHLSTVVKDMGFVVKHATRPSIKFEKEDVNYYNFRTSVITKTTFDDMTITFHDDLTNNTFSFYNACLNALSPITRNGNKTDDALEMEGMNFSPGTPANQLNHTASLGVLAGDSKQTLFQSITLYHIFDYGRHVNVYTLYNPKITAMTLDTVDMAESTLNEMTFAFVYDYVNVETKKMEELKETMAALQSGARYTISDVSSIEVASTKGATISSPTTGNIVNGCNPLNYVNTTPPNAR